MITIISTLTVVVSLITKFVGFPDQIRLMLKHKQANNISLSLNLLGAISYGLWTIHGYLRNDWFTVVGQILGFVFSLILVWLTIKYRKPADGENTNAQQ